MCVCVCVCVRLLFAKAPKNVDCVNSLNVLHIHKTKTGAL